MDSFSGHRVGPYCLTDCIGSGASCNVYRAVDITSKRHETFAVKCLQKAKVSCRRWSQLVGEIVSHDAMTGSSHVVPLCNVIEEDSYFFLILGLCEMDLYAAIWKKKVYWRNDALIRKAFIEILDGVIACHLKGIFHRDLKPSNIMCKADGTGIRIGDFGLATYHQPCLDGGCGTPDYMSPECWMCDEKEPYNGGQSDVWSLGVILFNMVTGRYPWEAALPSDDEFTAFINDEDYLFHTSPISDSLSDLLKWILHPIPTRRFSIPVIRQAVLEMDTFYKRRRMSPDCSASSNLELVVFGSERTCNEPSHPPNPNGKKKSAATSL